MIPSWRASSGVKTLLESNNCVVWSLVRPVNLDVVSISSVSIRASISSFSGVSDVPVQTRLNVMIAFVAALRDGSTSLIVMANHS